MSSKKDESNGSRRLKKILEISSNVNLGDAEDIHSSPVTFLVPCHSDNTEERLGKPILQQDGFVDQEKKARKKLDSRIPKSEEPKANFSNSLKKYNHHGSLPLGISQTALIRVKESICYYRDYTGKCVEVPVLEQHLAKSTVIKNRSAKRLDDLEPSPIDENIVVLLPEARSIKLMSSAQPSLGSHTKISNYHLSTISSYSQTKNFL